jgi:hypothetical protein
VVQRRPRNLPLGIVSAVAAKEAASILERIGLEEDRIYRESIPKDRAVLIRAFRRLKVHYTGTAPAGWSERIIPAVDDHIARLHSIRHRISLGRRRMSAAPVRTPGRVSDRIRESTTWFSSGPPPEVAVPTAPVATPSPGVEPGAHDLLLLERTGVLDAWARVEQQARRLRERRR